MGKVVKIPVRDVFETNSYLYFDEDSKEGFLIDPGAQANKILTIAEEHEVVIKRILLTHGHFDHTGAVKEIASTFDIPYSIHEEGLRYLKDASLNLSANCGRHVVLQSADTLSDNEMFSLDNGRLKLTAIHTPGHTPDSCVFYSPDDNIAFVGDTIFRGNIGATHYPGGDSTMLKESIINRIFTLPPQTLLLSGHSDATDVQTERTRYGF